VRSAGRDRWLALVAPILLLAVATVAVVRFHWVQQSSWQGAGFGMFATHDYVPSRALRATASIGGTDRAVPIPAGLGSRVERVLAAPGDAAMVSLAEDLRSWAGADGLVLEVVGHDVTLDHDAMVVTLRSVRRVEVP